MPRSNKKTKTGRPPLPLPKSKHTYSIPSVSSSSSAASSISILHSNRKERRAAAQATRPQAIPVPHPVYRVQDSDEDVSEVEEGQIQSAQDERNARMEGHYTEPVAFLSSPLPRKPTFATMNASTPASTYPHFLPDTSSTMLKQNAAQQYIPIAATSQAAMSQRRGEKNQLPSSLASNSTSLPAWTSGEKAEAMKLIKEITALGLDPAQLVEAGIRQEIVAFCCNELHLPFSSQNRGVLQRDSVLAGPSGNIAFERRQGDAYTHEIANGIDVFKLSKGGRQIGNTSRRAKRPQSASVVEEAKASKPLTATAMPNVPSGGGSAQSMQSTSMTADYNADQGQLVPPTEALPDVEAMRRAALASMKRKKAAAEEQDSRLFDSKAQSEVAPIIESASSIDVPKGPKNLKPAYHDIDAPPAQIIDFIDGEGDDELQGEAARTLSISMDLDSRANDPRQMKRSNILSYADKYSWDVDAPTGEVDLEAPLPSLHPQPRRAITESSKATSSRSTIRRRPVAADLMDLSNATHIVTSQPKPFLPNATWQKMILDCSDDDEADDDNDEHGQARQASTAFIAQNWKQLSSEEEQTDSPRIGNGLSVVMDNVAKGRRSPLLLSRSTSDAVLKKEQEIREMTAKIQELEKKRGQIPTDVKILADVALEAVESENATSIIVEGSSALILEKKIQEDKEAVRWQGDDIEETVTYLY